MAEWLKAIDCKSIDSFYVGSNPTFPNKTFFLHPRIHSCHPARVPSTVHKHRVRQEDEEEDKKASSGNSNFFMPQLDKVTFLSQFFWLCFFYLGFYFFVLKYVLPKMSRILALRKRKMGSSQEGIAFLQQENQQVRHQFDTVVSKALSTSRILFHDFFSQTGDWLQKSTSLINKNHYENVNQAYIQSLGETSLSQNILFYHASKKKTSGLTFQGVVEKMKHLASTSKKVSTESQNLKKK